MSLLGGLEEVVEFFFRRALSLSKSAIRASALSNCSCNWATTASSRLQPGQCSLCVPMPQQHKDDFGNHLHQFAIFVTAYDYVEPSDANLPCYSYRIHELLLRASVEVEANCKAILSENGYAREGDWNMKDYRKIEASHRLSRYVVKLPFWQGDKCTRTPFAAWAHGGSLPWYQAYNTTKHDRHNAFSQATFQHMTDAFAGLLALLSSQFYTHDFSPGNVLLASEGPRDGMEAGIGDYLRVKFPDDWPASDRYDFEWDAVRGDPNPFQQYDYTRVA